MADGTTSKSRFRISIPAGLNCASVLKSCGQNGKNSGLQRKSPAAWNEAAMAQKASGSSKDPTLELEVTPAATQTTGSTISAKATVKGKGAGQTLVTVTYAGATDTPATGLGTATKTYDVKPEDTREGKTIEFTAAAAPNLSVTKKAYVINLTISPRDMDVMESKDSAALTVNVKPADCNPTYKWLSGSTDNAWPAAAGNNPQLDYKNKTDASTIVQKTRWFAPTNNRLQAEDGIECRYSINCEITVQGVALRANIAAYLNVKVDLDGATERPSLEGEKTIVVEKRTVNGVDEWYVAGQGQFRRKPAFISKLPPATSRFYGKVKAHEEVHLRQNNVDGDGMALWNADLLYLSVEPLTSRISEESLRAAIHFQIWWNTVRDPDFWERYQCDWEKEAYGVQDATPPDFLIYEEGWKQASGCQ